MSDFKNISLDQIHTNPYQPRKIFNQEKIKELAQSIQSNGIIQPIIVRENPLVGYEILAGERRYRAAKIAGLEEIPAIVKELTDTQMMHQAIIENLQRENLNPVEEARSYQKLIDNGLTHEQIAHVLGKSRPYVSNIVRILQLQPNIIKAIEENVFSAGHARLLVPLSQNDQDLYFHKIINEKLSVRKTEELLKKKQKSDSTKDHSKDINRLYIESEEKKLKRILGNNVTIKMNQNGKGQLTIHFDDLESYERIIHILD